MGVIRQALDLTRNAWVKKHGDITVYGTWWNDEHDGWLPCMALVPTFRQERITPCVVTMDLAWIWSEEEGSMAFAVETALDFAETLGLPPDQKSVIRVASLIRDHLGDMISIPPRPVNDNEIVVADGFATINGKTHHAEIKSDV